MVYNNIAEYLEAAFGITEFWFGGKRYMKTVEGEWIIIK